MEPESLEIGQKGDSQAERSFLVSGKEKRGLFCGGGGLREPSGHTPEQTEAGERLAIELKGIVGRARVGHMTGPPVWKRLRRVCMFREGMYVSNFLYKRIPPTPGSIFENQLHNKHNKQNIKGVCPLKKHFKTPHNSEKPKRKQKGAE